MSPDPSRDDHDPLRDHFREAGALGTSFLDDPAGARRAGSRRVARQRASAGVAVAAAVGVVAVLSAGGLGPEPVDPLVEASPHVTAPTVTSSATPSPSSPSTTATKHAPLPTTTGAPVREDWPIGTPLLEGGHTLGPTGPEGGGSVEDWVADPCHRGDLLAEATVSEHWEARMDAEYQYRVVEQLVRFPDAESAADLVETVLADAQACPAGPVDEVGSGGEKEYGAKRFDLAEDEAEDSWVSPFPSDDVIIVSMHRFMEEGGYDRATSATAVVVRHGSVVALYAFVPGMAQGLSDHAVEIQLAREFATAAVS